MKMHEDEPTHKGASMINPCLYPIITQLKYIVSGVRIGSLYYNLIMDFMQNPSNLFYLLRLQHHGNELDNKHAKISQKNKIL